MRVIRTEMYFDDDTIEGAHEGRRRLGRFPPSEEENYGLAFAWFRGDDVTSSNIKNYKWFDGHEIGVDQVPQALDMLLRDVEGREIRSTLEIGNIKNRAVVDFAMGAEIVLELSPPTAAPFKSLLKKTNSAVLIGAYIGMRMAGDNPALMILTIPGGIIVVGSALGIADAMAYGLNKRVKRLFDRK